MKNYTGRPTVEAMEYELEAVPKQILDQGFIKLVDYMGDDEAIVQAARVSYNKGTVVKNDNRGTIRHMMREGHTSPFEMCEIKLHVKLPIFVARQWIRHRTANVNEMSARYSILENEFYFPDDINGILRNMFLDAAMASYDCYAQLLDHDVNREKARIVLPTNIYTQWYWKIDLANLLHFLLLRTDSHAQAEIREYANYIEHIVSKWVPLAYEAWIEYKKNAVTFSATQIQVIKDMLKNGVVDKNDYSLTKNELDKITKIFRN